MSNIDTIQHFLIESASIRGEIVHLHHTLDKMFINHPYTLANKILLAEAAAAGVLLSSTIKFNGQLSIQLQGSKSSPLQLLVVQCSNDFSMRGILHMREEKDTNDLKILLEDGQLAITVQSEQYVHPYQSLVPLQDSSLNKCLENYFQQSEQLPTRIYLFANETYAAGLLLQVVPEASRNEDDWQRITLLADTLASEELIYTSADKIISRLFHEEDVRVYSPKAVRFRCTCSQLKMEEALHVVGSKEAHEILAESGKVEITCDFCHKHYVFDKTDIERIFGENVVPLRKH